MKKIKVISLIHKISASGKKFSVVRDEDNNVFYCFEPTVQKFLKEGEVFDITIREDGKFKSITYAQNVTFNGNKNGFTTNSQASITASVALDKAILTLAHKLNPDEVVALAKKYVVDLTALAENKNLAENKKEQEDMPSELEEQTF